MKLIYGKDIKVGGNLGDELNEWIFYKLFGKDLFDDNTSTCFLGIGSILCADETYCKEWINKKKLVFGTGVRPFHKQIEIDDSYDIKFLRGPLSSYTLGLNKDTYICDGAYCLNLLPEISLIKNTTKKYKIGLIPYFKSQNLVDWEEICRNKGFKLINPICSSEDIETRLYDIASCNYIITEAMHGAILSDIFRIPWSRFILSTYKYEQSSVSEFKWMDWLFSMEMRMPETVIIPLTNKLNNAVSKISNNLIVYNHIFKESLIKRIENVLKFNKLQFNLSKDQTFSSKMNLLYDQVELVKCQYK